MCPIAFSLAATFVFVSLMSIAQLIGPKILGSLLTGRYYYPITDSGSVVLKLNQQAGSPRRPLSDL